MGRLGQSLMCYDAFNRGVSGQQDTEKLRQMCLSRAPSITKKMILEVCSSEFRLQWALRLSTLNPLPKYGQSVLYL